jgi:hypothetical protein
MEYAQSAIETVAKSAARRAREEICDMACDCAGFYAAAEFGETGIQVKMRGYRFQARQAL